MTEADDKNLSVSDHVHLPAFFLPQNRSLLSSRNSRHKQNSSYPVRNVHTTNITEYTQVFLDEIRPNDDDTYYRPTNMLTRQRFSKDWLIERKVLFRRFLLD